MLNALAGLDWPTCSRTRRAPYRKRSSEARPEDWCRVSATISTIGPAPVLGGSAYWLMRCASGSARGPSLATQRSPAQFTGEGRPSAADGRPAEGRTRPSQDDSRCQSDSEARLRRHQHLTGWRHGSDRRRHAGVSVAGSKTLAHPWRRRRPEDRQAQFITRPPGGRHRSLRRHLKQQALDAQLPVQISSACPRSTAQRRRMYDTPSPRSPSR